MSRLIDETGRPLTVVLFRSFFEAISLLSDAERLLLYDAVMRFSFYGIEPSFESDYIRAIFTQVRAEIEGAYRKMGLKMPNLQPQEGQHVE